MWKHRLGIWKITDLPFSSLYIRISGREIKYFISKNPTIKTRSKYQLNYAKYKNISCYGKKDGIGKYKRSSKRLLEIHIIFLKINYPCIAKYFASKLTLILFFHDFFEVPL